MIRAATSSPAGSTDLRETAAEWLMRRQDASWSAEDERELAAWLDADPAHRQAFDSASRTWQDFSAVPRPVLATDATPARMPSSEFKPGVKPRPKLEGGGFWAALTGRPAVAQMAATVCLFVAVGAGYGWHRWQYTPGYSLALATAAGEIRQLDLPDGTHVALNADSSVSVRYYPRHREVVLDRGEAFFQVAPDVDRPFTVDTGPSRVTVVGTAFDVRAASPHVVVKVLHGRVRVTPDRARADETVSLGAEQGVAVDPATGMHQPVVAVADSVGGWRNGRLVFRRTPLAEVAEEVAQYLGKPVTFEAPQLRTLTVSGFATTDAPAVFLEALPDLLPVRVKRGADGGYVIADR